MTPKVSKEAQMGAARDILSRIESNPSGNLHAEREPSISRTRAFQELDTKILLQIDSEDDGHGVQDGCANGSLGERVDVGIPQTTTGEEDVRAADAHVADANDDNEAVSVELQVAHAGADLVGDRQRQLVDVRRLAPAFPALLAARAPTRRRGPGRSLPHQPTVEYRVQQLAHPLSVEHHLRLHAIRRLQLKTTNSVHCRPLMRRLQLRFDFDSTGVRLLIEGHRGQSDVTRAADPLAAYADLFIYLFTPRCSSPVVT